MLTDAEIASYHEQLLALKARLTEFEEVSRETSKTVDLDEPIGRLSRIDAIQQQKMSQAHQRRNDVRLQQLFAALKRIDEGDYGECLRCGEFIPKPRLDARPEVPVCIECQTELESK